MKLWNRTWILAALLAGACGESAPGDGASVTGDTARTRVQLVTHQLPTLRNGFEYEGWAILDGSPISFGKFNVDDSGAAVDEDGIAISEGIFSAGRDISAADALVLTVEPVNDPDIAPAETKILATDLAAGQDLATLETDHPAVLGTDFSAAEGRFILATPTDDDDSNELSGLWFLDLSVTVPEGQPPAPGLVLPELPLGWAYEGWAVIDGQPVSTGRFRDVSAADDNAMFSGPQGAPPRPGEDFLINAPAGLSFPTTLAGMTAVISVEPEPDDSAAPFALKPLVMQMPGNSAPHQTLSMANNAVDLPEATFELLE